MDTIDKRDVTDRAIAGGWVLPDGWTVTAELSYDHDRVLPSEYDCYSDAQITAWRNDEWGFGVVCVFVEDDHGRDWGRAIIGGVEYGHLPNEDGTDSTFVDPLEDVPASYSVIREGDMIGEALRDAVERLEGFGTPVLVEPDGPTVSGL